MERGASVKSWAAMCILVSTLFCSHIPQVQADEEVACFKCDYISESSDDQHCLNPRKDATPTASCQVCQTQYYGGNAIKIIKRDCVAHCESTAIPVRLKGTEYRTGSQSCCQDDFCNTHFRSSTVGSHSSHHITLLFFFIVCFLLTSTL